MLSNIFLEKKDAGIELVGKLVGSPHYLSFCSS